MRLLGENLVMFRDSNGDVGCFKEVLPAPWRVAVLRPQRGSRPALRLPRLEVRHDRRLHRHAVRAGREQLQEQGARQAPTRRATSTTWSGSTWARARCRRPSRSSRSTRLPPENVAPPAIMMEEANWFQNLEGDIDSQPPRLPALTPRRLPPAPLRRAAERRLEARPVLHGLERQDAAPGRAPDRLRCLLQRPPRLG